MRLQKEINLRREMWRGTQIGHVNKGQHLFVGKVYCGVDKVKMPLHRDVKRRTFKNGTQWEKEYIHYRCNTFGVGLEKDGCARQVQAHIVEEMAWNKIWEFISTPGAYEDLIQRRIDALAAYDQSAGEVIPDREKRLRELDEERQMIYTLFRKKKTTLADMDRQLGTIDVEEGGYRKELTAAMLASQRTVGDLEILLRDVQEDVLGTINALRQAVLSEEDAAQQWAIKKHIVDYFVEKVLVYKYNSRADDDFEGRGGAGVEVQVGVELVTDLEKYSINHKASR